MSNQSKHRQSDLPAQNAGDVASDHELTDQDLEQVAGGLNFTSPQSMKAIGVGELHSEKMIKLPSALGLRGSE